MLRHASLGNTIHSSTPISALPPLSRTGALHPSFYNTLHACYTEQRSAQDRYASYPVAGRHSRGDGVAVTPSEKKSLPISLFDLIRPSVSANNVNVLQESTPRLTRLADLVRPSALNEVSKCVSEISLDHAPPPSEMQEPGRQLKITNFFNGVNESNSGLLYAPASGFSCRAGPPPRGMAGVSSVSASCLAWIGCTPDDNEGPLVSSQSRPPRSECRRLRRQAYRKWKTSVCGGVAQGLDSLGLHFSRSGDWQPSKPPKGASRSGVRMALTGQRSVLRSTELWERNRLNTPPSVTRLGSRVSNTYLHRERTTLVRSFLFQEKSFHPCPSEPPTLL